MNLKVIFYIQGIILKFEAAFLMLPCIVAFIYRERQGLVYLVLALLCLAAGTLMTRRKPGNMTIYATEGLLSVAFAWILLSLTGAVPFVLTGDIPRYIDAVFETASGFTTTGASILTDVGALTKSGLFWRSCTPGIGGMGGIVFVLAIMPMMGGYNMHLMRAESPGPTVGKLVPKMRDSAKLLYIIYLALTLAETIILFITGLPLFDALTISFGSAGTGGFAVRSSGMADYSILSQAVIAVFIVMFGINFNFYYLIRGKDRKQAFKMTEVKGYLILIAVSVAAITADLLFYHTYLNPGRALHEAFFQVGSIITTTGFATADFNVWPSLSKSILLILMFIGACAGSTGGGFKVSRVLILAKSFKQEVIRLLHPRSVITVKMDGKALDKETVRQVAVYAAVYIGVFVASFLLINVFEEHDMETTFSAVTACYNNIGPGFSLVGPMANYSFLSVPAKLILIFDMLAGRLELYPILILFVPEVWKKAKKQAAEDAARRKRYRGGAV